MKILITGGSGFIGTNYIKYLLNLDNIIFINLDINSPRNPKHKKFWYQCNILDRANLQSIIEKFQPTHIVHLAAKTGMDEESLDTFAANMEGVKNLLKICNNSPKIKRVIFTSTLLVNEIGYISKFTTDYNASTLYGQSKVEGEKIIRSFKNPTFSWCIIRPISIWGPWCDEPYKNFFKLISKNYYFHIGSGHYKRSIGYVENTAHQIHELLISEKKNVDKKTFYLADEHPVDLYSMANLISENMQSRKIWNIPLWIAKFIAFIGDICKKIGWHNVPLTSFRLNNMLTEYTYNVDPIIKIAGGASFDLQSGIDRTVKWLRDTDEIS